MEPARLYLLGESEEVPEPWVVPELPAMPAEVALLVVRFAQYLVSDWAHKTAPSV